MSDPDKLAKLKARVEVYESEVTEAKLAIANDKSGNSPAEMGLWAAMIGRYIDATGKLQRASNEYITELEKLVPR